MIFFDTQSIFKDYDFFKESKINDTSKVFRYSNLINLLNKYKKICSIQSIGESIEKRKIFKMQWGIGKKKIIIWSQMHGNETTGTKSMFDVFHFLLKKKNHELVKFFFKNITILFIPMLNPDGSEYFQRRNAINIDLNRDSIRLESPEIKVLFNEIKKNDPYILFNLHDQKSIYNVDDKFFNPAILSFLSPSNKKNIINHVKMKSMGIIYEISKEIHKKILNKKIKGSIGRYSDKYYPNATGDFFQEKGYPCVLIESGNYINDIQKNIVRKYHTLSILLSFYILSNENKNIEINYKSYSSIKENKNILLDKIYRKVKIIKNKFEYSVDIGLINFEKFDKKNFSITPDFKIVDIGDLSNFFAYEDIINPGFFFSKKDHKLSYPKIGESENFYMKK